MLVVRTSMPMPRRVKETFYSSLPSKSTGALFYESNHKIMRIHFQYHVVLQGDEVLGAIVLHDALT